MLIRVGDVARDLGVTVVTVRWWCKEFRVQPRRHGGQRSFTEHNRARLASIKSLLRDEGFTIAGAKKKLGIT